MGTLWNITLTNQHNATYTCSLMDVPDASALKRLEIKSDSGASLAVAIVEPKPEGVYIKEVAAFGERLGFRKENAMLLPAEAHVDDTWQVSTEKKNRLVRIGFKMAVTLVEAEPQRRVLSVSIEVNGRGPLKKRHETLEAIVSINPDDFQIERLELRNGDIYESHSQRV